MSEATESGPDTDPPPSDESGLFDVDPKWFKVGFYFFLLLWLAYILWETQTYTQFEDTFFPYVIGIPISLLLLLQLLLIQFPEIDDRVKPDQETTGASESDELQQRMAEATETNIRPKREREWYEIVMIGWVIILPFMMYYLGLGWTLFLYVFAFTWYFVRDLRTAVTVTVVVVVFVLILFLQFLDMFILPGELGLPDPLVYLDDLVNSIL